MACASCSQVSKFHSPSQKAVRGTVQSSVVAGLWPMYTVHTTDKFVACSTLIQPIRFPKTETPHCPTSGYDQIDTPGWTPTLRMRSRVHQCNLRDVQMQFEMNRFVRSILYQTWPGILNLQGRKFRQTYRSLAYYLRGRLRGRSFLTTRSRPNIPCLHRRICIMSWQSSLSFWFIRNPKLTHNVTRDVESQRYRSAVGGRKRCISQRSAAGGPWWW